MLLKNWIKQAIYNLFWQNKSCKNLLIFSDKKIYSLHDNSTNKTI